MGHKNKLEQYAQYLQQEELADATIQIYLKQAELFLDFLGKRELTKAAALAYKKGLQEKYTRLSTINLYLAALNRYLQYTGHADCVVKALRQQRRQCPDNVLSVGEYERLLLWAKENGREKYYCIMRTLALTGIRVSELAGLTVESLEQGSYIIRSKGKNREIYLPDKLVADIRNYCACQRIEKGIIFRGKDQKPISRVAVYKMLVKMAECIGIPKERVHPHSFRHLFAVTYMRQYSNLFELADILGHASLETTRIYTVTTAEEKRRKINRIKL